MIASDLQKVCKSLGVSKADLAQLLGVTTRAVNLWVSSEREIPGPVTSYLRLLASLPNALIAQELSRLQTRDTIMYSGIYLVKYIGETGGGDCTLIFMDGIVFGHDGQVSYDGTYEPCPNDPGKMLVKLTLTVPPGVSLVQDVGPQPMEYSFGIEAIIPARGSAKQKIKTPINPLSPLIFQIDYLRPLPVSLAA